MNIDVDEVRFILILVY